MTEIKKEDLKMKRSANFLDDLNDVDDLLELGFEFVAKEEGEAKSRNDDTDEMIADITYIYANEKTKETIIYIETLSFFYVADDDPEYADTDTYTRDERVINTRFDWSYYPPYQWNYKD
jgi:hypothetical protein